MPLPSIPPSAPFVPTKFNSEYWIDPVNGLDSNVGSTPAKPWKTLTKAFSTVGNGVNLNLAVGTYTESPITSTLQDLNITGMSGASNIVNVSTQLTFNHSSSSVFLTNIYFGTVIFSGDGNLYLDGSTVSNVLSKTGNGYLGMFKSNTKGNLLTGSVNITGSGNVDISASSTGLMSINNSSAKVLYQGCINSNPITLTSGSLYISGSQIYSLDEISNSITTSAGTTVEVSGSQLLTPNGSLSRINIGGLYSLQGVQFDSVSSLITGSSLGITTNFDNINISTINIDGGSINNTSIGITTPAEISATKYLNMSGGSF